MLLDLWAFTLFFLHFSASFAEYTRSNQKLQYGSSTKLMSSLRRWSTRWLGFCAFPSVAGLNVFTEGTVHLVLVWHRLGRPVAHVPALMRRQRPNVWFVLEGILLHAEFMKSPQRAQTPLELRSASIAWHIFKLSESLKSDATRLFAGYGPTCLQTRFNERVQMCTS